MSECKTQNTVSEAARCSRLKEFTACCFQELTVFDARRTDLFAGTTAKATIDMTLERG